MAQREYSLFISKITDIQSKVANLLDKPVKLVSAIIEDFGFRKFYQDESKSSSDLDNASDDVVIEVIISVASAFDNNADFYDHVCRSSNNDYTSSGDMEERGKDEVLLASIHSCKGKEFGNVVYFNLSENGRKASESDTEEERRVCYVGVTRAIQNLMITANRKGYSLFLPELLKNPDFIRKSTVMLNTKLAKMRTEEQLLSGKIKGLENEKELIFGSYPELKGEDLQTEGQLFRKTSMKMRMKKIEKAGNKIETVQNQLEKYSMDLVAKQDTINEILTEIGYRDLL